MPERRDVVRVAVAGGSGYIGAELLRLLLGHPTINVTGVTSDRLAGEPLARAYPHLRGLTELSFHDLDAGWLAEVADAVVLALPHLESQRVVPVLRRRGVGDLGLALRFGVVGAVGSVLGALLALELPAGTLRIVFAVFVGVVGLRLARDGLRGDRSPAGPAEPGVRR